MSAELLQRVSAHIEHLIFGYSIRYYRWSDEDLSGNTPVVLFRSDGIRGQSDHQLQYIDVSMQMVCNPNAVQAGDAVILSVLRYLRSEGGFSSDAVGNFEPIAMTGPVYLQNGRARFELVVRCMVEDH